MNTSMTADRLHSLAIHLLRYARVEDMATGLSAARLSVLSVLVFGGTRAVTELATAEQVATPTMTKLLQGLEADGYVTRRRDAADGRVVRVAATRRGRNALQQGRATRVRRIGGVLERLTDAQRREVERVVAVLGAALRQASGGPA